MDQQQIWVWLSCGKVRGFLDLAQPLLSRAALEGDLEEDVFDEVQILPSWHPVQMLSMSSYKYMKKIQEGFYLVFPGYLASFLEVFSCSLHFCAVHFLTLFLLLSGSISPLCISLPSPAQLTRGQISFHGLKGSPLRKKKKKTVVHTQ